MSEKEAQTLSLKAGDHAAAKYYDQLAKSLGAPKAQEVPLHQFRQQLAADVEQRERRLEHEFAKPTKSACRSLRLPLRPKLRPPPAKVDIKDLVEGKVDFATFFNLDSVLDVQRDVEDIELTAEDQKELQIRKSTMSEAIKERAPDLFKGALDASQKAREDHDKHKSRPTKKRNTEDGAK
ncbi:unnamed protein product, partial [Prorocentrum cordatum]